jgi:hypothetical protein
MVCSGGGIFGCLACGPPRQVRSWKPSATDGRVPKKMSSSRRMYSRSFGVNGQAVWFVRAIIMRIIRQQGWQGPPGSAQSAARAQKSGSASSPRHSTPRADYRLNGWLFRPIVATAGPLVAVVEQCPHIALVEWLGQLLGEVGSDMLKDQPPPYHHERCRQDWSEHRVRHVRGDVAAEDYARH